MVTYPIKSFVGKMADADSDFIIIKGKTTASAVVFLLPEVSIVVHQSVGDGLDIIFIERKNSCKIVVEYGRIP